MNPQFQVLCGQALPACGQTLTHDLEMKPEFSLDALPASNEAKPSDFPLAQHTVSPYLSAVFHVLSLQPPRFWDLNKTL